MTLPLTAMRAGLSEADDASIDLRAAQYVRMSTDHQQYSTQNQADVIAAYAAQHKLTIVREYADESRSGLHFNSRPALKQLISDVILGHANFSHILVYDVSRWGRFQDIDESAHYEFICREAGVGVEYCAEQFRNDGSLMSNIAKSLKRAMAGEFSRELSPKVFAAQCRLIKLGFKHGGSAPYGLNRQLLDENGVPQGILAPGQRKSLQTDRVILTPGSPFRVEIVRRIFREFVSGKTSEIHIARKLNSEGLTNQFGRPWTRWLIHDLLLNENYIGNSVYNRRSLRLGTKPKRNPESTWVRKDAAFKPIIDVELFRRAGEIIAQRRLEFSDEALLERLHVLLNQKGRLSKRLIDQTDDMPCAQIYQERFGGLLTAFGLIGYKPPGRFDYIEAHRRLRAMPNEIAAEALKEIKNVGGTGLFEPKTSVLTINSEFSALILAVRCTPTRAKFPSWRIKMTGIPAVDMVLVARMDERALRIADYYLLPGLSTKPLILLDWRHGRNLERHRFAKLNSLFGLSRLALRNLIGPTEANTATLKV